MSPLHNRALVFYPEAGTFFVGVHRAKIEAFNILLQHLYLILIRCISLQEEHTVEFKVSMVSIHLGSPAVSE